MNQFLKTNGILKGCLIASGGLIVLAVTLSFTVVGRSIAQSTDDCITICTTAANPLHVISLGLTRITGSVTINNEDAIATTVTGPVEVRTSPREPLRVIQRLEVDDIFQKQVSLTLEPGDTVETRDFLVPADKFLEIKNASGMVTVKSQGYTSQNFLLHIRIIQGNNSGLTFWVGRDQLPEVSHANGFTFSNWEVGANFPSLGVLGTPSDTVQVRLGRGFVSPNAEIKLDLAITGMYHDG